MRSTERLRMQNAWCVGWLLASLATELKMKEGEIGRERRSSKLESEFWQEEGWMERMQNLLAVVDVGDGR